MFEMSGGNYYRDLEGKAVLVTAVFHQPEEPKSAKEFGVNWDDAKIVGEVTTWVRMVAQPSSVYNKETRRYEHNVFYNFGRETYLSRPIPWGDLRTPIPESPKLSQEEVERIKKLYKFDLYKDKP